MSSFSLRNGDLGKAFSSFAWAVFVFILMPLSVYAMFTGISGLASQSGSAFIDADTLSQVNELLKETVERAIKYAVPFLIIAIPMGFYPKGNAAKIPFRLMWAFYMAVWIWIISQGGMFAASLENMTFGSISIGSVNIVLDVTFILYITLMICIAKGFLAFSEYGSYHQEYLDNIEKNENKKERKNRKKRNVSEEL